MSPAEIYARIDAVTADDHQARGQRVHLRQEPRGGGGWPDQGDARHRPPFLVELLDSRLKKRVWRVRGRPQSTSRCLCAFGRPRVNVDSERGLGGRGNSKQNNTKI